MKPDYSYKFQEEKTQANEVQDYKTSELHLLGLCMMSRKAFLKVEEELGIENFSDTHIQKALELIGNIYADGSDEINISKLVSRLSGEKQIHDAVIKSATDAEITIDREKALSDCIFFMKKEKKQETLQNLANRLKEAQHRNNNEEINNILLKINKIHKEKVV